MITTAGSCLNSKPNNTSDCIYLSANGVACCYEKWKNTTFCLLIYSNQTKYILNNNYINSPTDSASLDCGTFGTYSLPTNTLYYGNGGMMLFNFLILIFRLLLVK